MTLLAKLNGLYDIACSLSILNDYSLSHLHLQMYEQPSVYLDGLPENHLSMATKRHLAYWIATYGLMRLFGSQQIIRISYLLEAAGFLWEYKHGNMNSRALITIWMCMGIWLRLFTSEKGALSDFEIT